MTSTTSSSAPMPTYAERCALAATHQGLDPIADELWRVGVEYAVLNLGGFCMGVVAERPLSGLVAVVTTWDSPEGVAVVGVYEREAWHDGGEPLRLRDDVALADVPEVVVEFLGGVK